jgi:hypothetical protein
MANKLRTIIFHSCFILFTVFIFFIVSNKIVFAGNTTIEVSPNSGEKPIGTPFSVDLTIQGNGDVFNAAQATVTVSNNLAIKNLETGDCNFSFVNTPTITNPSFVGVLLGSSQKTCTVYTITLIPTADGQGSITLSNASVKSFPDALNVLASLQNGTYIITAADGEHSLSPKPILPTEVITNIPTMQEKQTHSSPYTITLRDDHNTPLSGITIILDPAPSGPPDTEQTTPETGTPIPTSFPVQIAKTDVQGIATFANVPQGVHTAVVLDDKKELAKNTFTVTGQNHTLVMGITAKKPANNFLPLLIIIIVMAGLGGFFLRHYFWAMKESMKYKNNSSIDKK